MDPSKPPYWFPAKRYGWGWGPPQTWQGWVTTIVWFAVTLGLSPVMVRRGVPHFLLFILGMSLLLMLICHAKGEPPQWRWGEGDDDSRK